MSIHLFANRTDITTDVKYNVAY